ncbi:MAG: hypothetical protein K2L07_05970 [Lachnospiraceae bacterium]|nr:hypothetical protein [Lachnospiraceae bacterium]
MGKNEYKQYESHGKKIIPCLCSWFDLLGYGTPFVDSKWDLSDEKCYNNFRRIEQVSHVFTTGWATHPVGVRLSINDGYACTIDIGGDARGISDTYTFLEGALQDFLAISEIDKRGGNPGVRGVITIGERFSHALGNEAVIAPGKTVSYFPSEFQMNTSFSKATIIEESGSRAGIVGSNLYIDKEIYNYLSFVAKYLGFQEPSMETIGNNIIVHVFEPRGWFADVTFDLKAVKYQKSEKYSNRGIETELYKFISIHSKIDDIVSEAVWQRMNMIRKMEEEEFNA